jgi:hypothetical protein
MPDKATMLEEMHGKNRFGDINAFLAVKLAEKNEECAICQKPFVAGENLIERYCCRLLTHVSCLSQWANTTPIRLGAPLGSPSRPLKIFSCPKCRRCASRASYFEILDKAFPPNAKATNDTSATEKTSTPETLIEAHNTEPPPKTAKLGRLSKPKTTTKAKKSNRRKKTKGKTENTTQPSQIPVEVIELQEFSESEVR